MIRPESRRGRPVPVRVNVPTRNATWSAFHRAKTSAPRRPFRRPARASIGSAAWPPQCRPSTSLKPPSSPCGAPGSPDPRPRVRLPAGHASLDLAVVRRLLQPLSTRGHTRSSCRSSHASEAFAPLLAGTNRCQLRWPSTALPRRRPASRALHAPAYARHVPLAWTRQLRGPRRSSEGEPRALDEIARALLVTPRAPGSPIRRAAWPGRPRGPSHRPRFF